MTVEIKKSRIHQGKLEKKIFTSVEEAKAYLKIDSLAVIYRTAKDVTVITAYGSGVFSNREWNKECEEK